MSDVLIIFLYFQFRYLITNDLCLLTYACFKAKKKWISQLANPLLLSFQLNTNN